VSPPVRGHGTLLTFCRHFGKPSGIKLGVISASYLFREWDLPDIGLLLNADGFSAQLP